MYDIIVIGGGPAGMTAALYALRNGKSALVIEKGGFGGQITHSPKVENYPGTLQMSGNEFADRMLEQILAQGADIEIETVTGIEDHGDYKTAVTEEGSRFDGRAVVIATGVRHRMLGLDGENELVGEEALLLSDKCASVTVVQDLPGAPGRSGCRRCYSAGRT